MREEHVERVAAEESPQYHPRHLRPMDESAVDEHHQVPREQVEGLRVWMESPRGTGDQ